MVDKRVAELLASVQGRDEDGDSKAMVSMQVLGTAQDNDWEIIEEISTTDAAVSFIPQGNVVTVVLDFDSDIDYDYLKFSEAGNRYNELLADRWKEEPVRLYAMNFSFVPQGDYDNIIQAICTGWYFVPEKNGQPHKLAFIGDISNFSVMEIPEELMQQALDEVGQELVNDVAVLKFENSKNGGD